MFEIAKSVFRYHRGAVTSVSVLNIFTFIPAATVFWLDPEGHIYYYSLIAAAAIISSWIFHWTTREARSEVRHFFIKMFLFFLVLAFIAAPLLLTFYFNTALFFANFFEVVYPNIYRGPDRVISYLITAGFYNLFFIGDYIKGFFGLFSRKMAQQKQS